jgi:hypothetical protein
VSDTQRSLPNLEHATSTRLDAFSTIGLKTFRTPLEMFTASRVIFELSVAALMLNTNGALGRAGAFAPLVLNVDSPMSSDAA